jgi:hypothetical protein
VILSLLLAAAACAQETDPRLRPVQEKVDQGVVSEVYGVKGEKQKGSVKAGASKKKRQPLPKAAGKGASRPVPPRSSWEVRKAGRLVLVFTVEPGLLTSRGAGGGAPHPFLTGSTLDPVEEDGLKKLLDGSQDASEFAASLLKAGYTLKDVSPAPPKPLPFGSAWNVYAKDGLLVLTFSNQPGTLASTALQAPGGTNPKHPFLTAAAKDPLSENGLKALLDESKDADGFVERLLKAGYSVLAPPR